MLYPQPTPSARLLAAAVYPNLGGVGGSGQLGSIVGALLTVVLILAVLMMVVCSATWAISSSHGNVRSASNARTGLWVAVGTAALAGAGVAWVNFLIHLGSTL